MASMMVCDRCEAVIRGPVAALRVRKGSARELGVYPIVGIFRPSERPKNAPERTEKDRPAPFPGGDGGRIRAPKRPVLCVGFFLQSVA